MTGDEVCAYIGDLMAGPARQWHLQPETSTRESWTALAEQFRVQNCCKCVSMVSRYYHASKYVDETPLEYLYRLNNARHDFETCGTATIEPSADTVDRAISPRELAGASSHTRSALGNIQRTAVSGLEKPAEAYTKLRNVHRWNFISQLRQWYDPQPDAGMLAPAAKRMLKPGPSQPWKPVKDGRTMSVYVYIGKKVTEGSSNLPGRTTPKRIFNVSVARPLHEYAREQPLGAKIHGKLNSRKVLLLLDTGAKVFILDSGFARDICCLIDTSVAEECIGIRDETYFTVGKTQVKVTLVGNMVYYMDLWVVGLTGQNVIFGMNFMVPAGVRIDTTDGTACFPGEVRIPIIGRRPLHGSRMHPETVLSLIRVPPKQTYVVEQDQQNLRECWVRLATVPGHRLKEGVLL
ncbi:Eukaryotic/viral aspartic protease [Phytophthora megakarya]|uniref:Eukaryotic/viral aspartic protease n=1 Tax=Phytophthora megakarya TaxID=4795 RepID=A0A225V3H1_9STRA|nr:Eukaryotic/viral aspartic protease [Phytophthora megakarya]